MTTLGEVIAFHDNTGREIQIRMRRNQSASECIVRHYEDFLKLLDMILGEARASGMHIDEGSLPPHEFVLGTESKRAFNVYSLWVISELWPIGSWIASKDKHNRPLGPRKEGTEDYAPVGARVLLSFEKMNLWWLKIHVAGTVIRVDGDMRQVVLDLPQSNDERVPIPIRGRSEVWVYYNMVRPI